jgi:hypothetical protein
VPAKASRIDQVATFATENDQAEVANGRIGHHRHRRSQATLAGRLRIRPWNEVHLAVEEEGKTREAPRT